MKKFLLVTGILLAVAVRMAAVEQNVIAIYPVDGEKALFAFADRPEMTYTTTDLVLTTSKTAVQFPIAQLKKVQFETAEMPEGLDETLADERYSFRDGSIVINGGRPNALVNIYTVSGTLAAQYRLDSNGNGVIPTQSLRGTTYIVTVGSFSFKFMQP